MRTLPDSHALYQTEKEAFAQAVYEIVRHIPYGRATSYGAIARAIGYSNMSRMVGRVMKDSNRFTENLPAHRVVNSQGRLSAKECFGHPGQMQQLLELEGIIVTKDKINNWKEIFWDPITEITLYE